ncbi:transposase [Frankia sp. CiP3]|uniref:IS66 family transposase n=1 Tax=Frankia sp. CiP3 TaxID=2880971 RepID=UPI002105C3B8|nr:transposase [Frankia sp. CiP3]
MGRPTFGRRLRGRVHRRDRREDPRWAGRDPPAERGRKQPVGRCLLECLRDRQDDVLRFVVDLDVWPTNNQSKRDLRPFKTQQKISGRLTSQAATACRLQIASYVSTARKHGVSALHALRLAFRGTPWMPPAAVVPT